MIGRRTQWTALSEAKLLAQCEVDTYRASGPGGQKRNKTSSAVRLRHLPSGLRVIAEESRSQHENKARALRRLRQALYLHIREERTVGDGTPEAFGSQPELTELGTLNGRLPHLTRKDPRFWPLVGLVLDMLEALAGRVSDAARSLGVSTASVVDFLRTEPKVWEQVNQLRARCGEKPLR